MLPAQVSWSWLTAGRAAVASPGECQDSLLVAFLGGAARAAAAWGAGLVDPCLDQRAACGAACALAAPDGEVLALDCARAHTGPAWDRLQAVLCSADQPEPFKACIVDAMEAHSSRVGCPARQLEACLCQCQEHVRHSCSSDVQHKLPRHHYAPCRSCLPPQPLPPLPWKGSLPNLSGLGPPSLPGLGLYSDLHEEEQVAVR